MDWKSATIISNFTPGMVVGDVGTSSIKAEELTRLLIRIDLSRFDS